MKSIVIFSSVILSFWTHGVELTQVSIFGKWGVASIEMESAREKNDLFRSTDPMVIEIKEVEMAAKGSFDVDLSAQDDQEAPAGRMLINKTYTGAMQGSGKGQMISKRTSNESAYAAVEEFVGTLQDKKGGFTLIHSGSMSAQSSNLTISILAGSGTGELEGINGEMEISQDESGHQYTLYYHFNSRE